MTTYAWQCGQCAFVNPASDNQCGVCTTPRQQISNNNHNNHNNYNNNNHNHQNQRVQPLIPITNHFINNLFTQLQQTHNANPDTIVTGSYAWYSVDNYGRLHAFPYNFNSKLATLDIGVITKFNCNNNQYKFEKSSTTTATQTNQETDIQRKVRYLFRENVIEGVLCQKNKSNTIDIAINDNVPPFICNMTYFEIAGLCVGDKIDCRGHDGYYYSAIIWDLGLTTNQEKSINVRFEGCRLDQNEFINIEKTFYAQLWRISKHKSITERLRHRFLDLNIGDYIDVNPTHCDQGWKHGEITQKDRKSGQIQVRFMHSTTKQPQLYWVHLDNKIECAEFGNGCIDKEQAVEMFKMELPSFEIVEITDISNKEHVNIYESILRSKCQGKCQGRQIEKFLWHGTSWNALGSISKNGFDRSYNRVGKYGTGTYFAKNASYCVSNRYCGQFKDGTDFILLCRVIVGDYVVGHQNMKQIPTKGDGSEYDSMVNHKNNPTIFVSMRDFMAVPYYLIRFRYPGIPMVQL